MKPRSNGVPGAQRSKCVQGVGPNWILIAGGALLSTLSIRLGCKLKQVVNTKEVDNTSSGLKGDGKYSDRKKPGYCRLHSNASQDEDGCFNCLSGGMVEIKQQPNGQLVTEGDMSLPLAKIAAPEYNNNNNRENGFMWASSPDHLELANKLFRHSPCVSEWGSDIFSKREVIKKLRQQLKRRDYMVMEMRDQIVELQNSLSAQLSHSTHLQSLLDVANRDLFESKREIQRLRKAIADHCVGPNGHVNDEKGFK